MQGHDGIVLYRKNNIFEIVAFRSNQLKSAITNKNYSSDPNITKETLA